MTDQQDRRTFPTPQTIPLLNVDHQTEVWLGGRVRDESESVMQQKHLVAIGDQAFIEATPDELRELAGQLGWIASQIEFDMIQEQVDIGRVMAEQERKGELVNRQPVRRSMKNDGWGL